MINNYYQYGNGSYVINKMLAGDVCICQNIPPIIYCTGCFIIMSRRHKKGGPCPGRKMSDKNV
jgi:hypothetical protein